MSRLFLAMLVAALAIPASASSQEPTMPPMPARVGVADFSEAFADPGEVTSRAYAEAEGLSLAEARRRLRLQNRAAALARTLERDDPERFAGLRIDGGTRVVVRFTDGQSPDALARLRGRITDAELLGASSVASAPRGLQDLRTAGATLERAARQAGLDAVVGINPEDGRLRLMVPDPAAVAAAVAANRLTLGTDVVVEQFEGIQVTEDVYGGRAYNASTGLATCSTGFTVLERATGVRGVTTAGHCDNSGRFSANLTSTYASSSVSLTFRQEWRSANANADGQDVQWHVASSSHVFPPVFWNGSSYVQVTGAEWGSAGSYVCKFGRTTAFTCGYVDAGEYYSSPYGYMGRVNASPTYPTVNDLGDSGGPVFRGSLAVGTVHGKDGSGNMYFMQIGRLEDLPIGVLCNC